ncbi:MAG: hypothetical protein GXO21_04165 [Aquificae bacterium]|nr:hypothetical protein [Aquificota bacterium]
MKKLDLVFQEIDKHLETLKYEKNKLLSLGVDNLSEADLLDYETIILLDAFIFRFIKLQSAIGEKLFPLFYEILTGRSYTEVAFIDILNTLEKYNFIPSSNYWNKVRKLRNEFIHIYPWETQLKIEAVQKAIKEIENIEKIYQKIKSFIDERKL